jgi:Domain of unknown function (DUF1905)
MTGSVAMEPRRFAAIVASTGRGKLLVPVPFNPDEVWGAKQRHHIAGTVNGIRVRAVIEPAGDGFGFALGRTSPGSRGVAVGDDVTVEIAPKGLNATTPPTTSPRRWRPTQTLARSSTRSRSSTGGHTCAGSRRRNTGPNSAPNA